MPKQYIFRNLCGSTPPSFREKLYYYYASANTKKTSKKGEALQSSTSFETFRMLGSGPGKKRPVSQCVLDPVFLPLPATPTPAAGGRVLIGPAGPLARAPIQGLRLGVRGYIGDACGPGTAAAAATYFSPAVVPPAAAPRPGDSAARQAESLTQ